MTSKILIVDDEINIRLLLQQTLEDLGEENLEILSAENGQQALALVARQAPDLILLDMMMPGMNGFQVLEKLKANPEWRAVPVIVISALNDFSNVVKGIQMGAVDYLSKPFDPVLLIARVQSSLEKKRWRDQEQEYLKIIQEERIKSERLLLNILPAPIAKRLKEGDGIIADSFNDVTILLADIVDFTKLSATIEPCDLVEMLNQVFSIFDRLVAYYGLEKIKTVGDAYMVVGGLIQPQPDHAEAIASLGLDMLRGIEQLNRKDGRGLNIRIGINSGPVVAGVIGKSKFSYDLWGDTVNIAAHMESHGLSGKIQTTEATYQRLRGRFTFVERGVIEVKGKGKMRTYFLTGRRGEIA